MLDLLPAMHLVAAHLLSGADRRALRATCRQLRDSAAILDTFTRLVVRTPVDLQPCDLPFLNRLSRLCQLRIGTNNLRPLYPLLALPGLTKMELDDLCRGPDLVQLSCAPSLLALRVCVGGKVDAKLLIPSLTSLVLRQADSTAILQQLVGLKDLQLEYGCDLRHLTALQALTRLAVECRLDCPLAMKHVQSLTALRVLEIPSTHNTQHISQLSQLSQLTALHLGLVLNGTVDLGRLTSLRHLGLSLFGTTYNISAPSIRSIFVDVSCNFAIANGAPFPTLAEYAHLEHILLRLGKKAVIVQIHAAQLPAGVRQLSVQHEPGGLVLGAVRQDLYQAVKCVDFRCNTETLELV